MLKNERLKKRINKAYSMVSIIEYLYGYVPVGDSILCPMHLDTRRSAKVYRDKDGDRIYCFCIKDGERVYTKRGSIPIQEVLLDDIVYSLGSGGLEENVVEGVFNQGLEECYSVRTGNCELKATGSHPILVLDREEGSWSREVKFKWVRIDEIKIGDLVVVVDRLPLADIVEESLGMCKLLGYWLGDGCWNGNYLSFSVKSNKKELIEEYEKIGNIELNKIFGDIVKFKKSSGCFYFRGVEKSVLEEKGFRGVSKTKRVPSWIWNAGREKILSFLCGFGDADGTVGEDGRLYYSFPQEEMAKDIMGLVDYLGIKRSNLTVSRPKGSSKEGNEYGLMYRFYVANPIDIGATMLDRKEKINNCKVSLSKFDLKKRLGSKVDKLPMGVVLQTVRKVESIGNFNVYDLKVKDRHNFICEGLVVHNTENKQFTVSDVLIKNNEDLNSWDPGSAYDAEDIVEDMEYVDIPELDKFKTGEIDLEQFFRILMEKS